MLEERIEFGIEGFRRGGIVLTRRDILEMFARAPESAGDLLPLIQADLAEMIQADLALEAISFPFLSPVGPKTSRDYHADQSDQP